MNGKGKRHAATNPAEMVAVNRERQPAIDQKGRDEVVDGVEGRAAAAGKPAVQRVENGASGDGGKNQDWCVHGNCWVNGLHTG